MKNFHDITITSLLLMFVMLFPSATDVQTARGRLTGALKVAVAPPSEDDEAVDPSLPGNKTLTGTDVIDISILYALL